MGVATMLAAVLVMAACRPAPPEEPAAPAWDPQTLVDCARELGDPVPGTPEWQQADENNQRCASEGYRMLQANPAQLAARRANQAAGQIPFISDPFRAPRRWKDTRGRYELVTFSDRGGVEYSAALFAPPGDQGEPRPGVVIACHTCALFETAEGTSHWYWAAEALAEAGYLVMYATILGNSAPVTVDAVDWFVATPEAPTARGEFNPWHAELDRDRLGLAGHSGAGVVSLDVGHSDPRVDVVTAWDPAPIGGMEDVAPRVPTMIQAADYEFAAQPRPDKPAPTLSKFGFFDKISAAGVDVMQLVPRSTTHLDWGHFSLTLPHGIYGEMVATYYTLAWFDRYLMPSRADDALRRLTASGTTPFDGSADEHSIGAGYYDAARVPEGGDVEAGNVPITIGGTPVRNLLSFQFDSKYFLDGGELTCADLRAGCPAQP